MNDSAPQKGISALIYQELQLLFYDKWLLFAAAILPAILFIFMFSLFRQGIVHELPVAVVDLDQGRFSRMLIRDYDADSHLRVICYPTVKAATTALRKQQVYSVVVLPAGMGKKIRLGQSPEITAFYNFQFILIGKVLKSAIATAHATFNAQLATVAGLAKGNVKLVQAQGLAVVTRKQITPLYNLGLNYNKFLVTALLPTVWQIVMVTTTVLLWAAEERRSGLNNWLRDQPLGKTVIRFGCYCAIFLLQGASFLAIFITQGWLTTEGLGLIFVAQWLTALACLAAGTLFFLLLPDAARALSIAASYVAPGFAFLGVTFPVTDMNTFAQIWHGILPISYYMEIQIGVMNHGASAAALLPVFQKLCCFLLLFIIVAVVICKKRKITRTKEVKQKKSAAELLQK